MLGDLECPKEPTASGMRVGELQLRCHMVGQVEHVQRLVPLQVAVNQLIHQRLNCFVILLPKGIINNPTTNSYSRQSDPTPFRQGCESGSNLHAMKKKSWVELKIHLLGQF